MFKRVSKKTDLILSDMTTKKITPKIGIAFFIIMGVFTAVWVWTSLILS